MSAGIEQAARQIAAEIMAAGSARRAASETGKRQPDLVTEWLMPRAARASGVTMREAVKWLPADQRDALMAAHRARRA